MRQQQNQPTITIRIQPPRDDLREGDYVTLRVNSVGIVYRVTLIMRSDYQIRYRIRPAYGFLRADARMGSQTVGRDDIEAIDLVTLGIEYHRLADLIKAVAAGTEPADG